MNDYLKADNSALSSSGILSSDVGNFLRTFAIKEVFKHTVTPTLLAGSYSVINEEVPYKSGTFAEPPRVLGFRVINEDAENEVWYPLPYYQFATTLEVTTNSFFVQEYAKVFAYRNVVEFLSQSQSPATQTYIIYVLEDKGGTT